MTPRPALPVGQHLHLTAWLVLLLPLALLPWREGGTWRWLASASGTLGVAAVLGGRTLAGVLALAVESGLFVAWCATSRRERGGRTGRLLGAAAVLAVVAVAAVWADAAAIVRGTDPSFAARRVYWQAGWAGVMERPVFGFGPGSTGWTLGVFLRPVPGVNPPTEMVGELHLLPLAVGYEVGVPGLLLAATVVGLFVRRRMRERSTARDPGLLRAGLLGLAGGACVGLATADWRVAALPVAAAAAAGAALAGGRQGRGEESGGEGIGRAGRIAVALYVATAAAVLAPLVVAHRHYDLAVDRPRGEALRRLDRALHLDSRFPLYRARRAWLLAEGERSGASSRDLRESRSAAEAAPGVGPLWLAAGAVAEANGHRAEAAFAFERACAVDPLGALPPFRLAQVGSPVHDAVAVAARSLAAEPRLAAAVWWQGREELLERVSRHLATTPGIDQGWRAELVGRVADLPAAGAGGGAEGSTGELALVFDAAPRDSASLHLFRRRPWKARLGGVAVDARGAETFADLPAATSLAGTDPLLFPPTCTGLFVPQRLRKTLWKTW